MSSFEIKKITDRAGTGSPNFTNGVKISGTDSGLLAPTRTESDTQPDPAASSNGDTFYDTANDTYDILVEGAWTRVLGAGGGAASWTVDLANVTYDNVSFSVAGQETGPYSAAVFNADGTKMYITGYTSDRIHQYTLSTGFDLSTASYDNVNFSVSGQEVTPTGMAFNPDGTKMYVVGQGSDRVHQYTLSTGFDLSTASYDNVSLSVSGQDVQPNDLCFNTDGTKMYMVGTISDAVYQYTLSTGFDLSTASYDNFSFSVVGQDTAPRGLVLSSDGSRLYVLGQNTASVYSYGLSTPFDLSTASYDNGSFSLSSSAGANPSAGVSFSADGTKMYVTSDTNDTIFQYSTGL